jgi:hypothetical protein
LRRALVRYSPQFVRVVTEKLLTYALGRRVDYYDMPAVRSITHEAEGNDNRFSSLVLGIVKSAPFQMNVKPAEKLAGSKKPTNLSPAGTATAAQRAGQ